MNSFKIAWRSIQHRGLGSLLTILSMALGVMLVVAVLTIHGVVSQSFKSNSTLAYDVIIGSYGSRMQVTMNTVFYLSSPVETIPYEYYLAFCDEDRRSSQLRHSVAWQTALVRQQSSDALDELAISALPGGGMMHLALATLDHEKRRIEEQRIGLNSAGSKSYLAQFAIPVNLGDYLGTFRVVGTTPGFFEHIELDIDTHRKMTFSSGRPFREFDETNQYFEAVLGSIVARELGYKVGDEIFPIHGDPNSSGAHTHEQGFRIVGILDSTGAPHDRAAFVNLEGFYLLDGHVKPMDERRMTDPFPVAEDMPEGGTADFPGTEVEKADDRPSPVLQAPAPLPIELREVTAVLVRSAESEEEEEDGFQAIGSAYVIQSDVDEGVLKGELEWSDYRPLRAQDAAQAVNPIMEVTSLFENLVNPIRWVLLVLTIMICVVSAISILVGIYSSMSQRRYEIAVIRALGASRGKVLMITLLESVMLALLGGMLGWVAGHVLNAAAGPLIESRTGVSIGFFDFAPGFPVLSWLGFDGLFPSGGNGLQWFRVSTELFLIPGLILLAILVGVYPAISAYRTDVAKSLS